MTQALNGLHIVPHDDSIGFTWQEWFRTVYNSINTPQYKILSGIPSTTEIPAGYWGIYKDSSGGTLKIYANDNGTMKSVTLT